MDIILELNCSECNAKYTTGGGGFGKCPSCSYDDLVKMPEWITFCKAMGFNPDARKVSNLYVPGNSMGDLANHNKPGRSRNSSKQSRQARQNPTDNKRKEKDE